MRIAILGATGFIGTRLLPRLADAGHDPVALSRSADRAREGLGPGVEVRPYDPGDAASVAAALGGAEAVVNLAGANLFAHRWTSAYRQVIEESRVDTTRNVVRALERLDPRPRVLVNASAVGIYGPRDPAALVDETAIDLDAVDEAACGFLQRVCLRWERAARAAREVGVREVRLRTAVVLGDGGALDLMARPFRLWVGGPVGSGRQKLSWVHREDHCRLIRLALEDDRASGPINSVAPDVVTNRAFSRALGQALDRPSWLRMPRFALRLVLGKAAKVVTTGQHVVPERARMLGFSWRYPDLPAALASIPLRPGDASSPTGRPA